MGANGNEWSPWAIPPGDVAGGDAPAAEPAPVNPADAPTAQHPVVPAAPPPIALPPAAPPPVPLAPAAPPAYGAPPPVAAPPPVFGPPGAPVAGGRRRTGLVLAAAGAALAVVAGVVAVVVLRGSGDGTPSSAAVQGPQSSAGAEPSGAGSPAAGGNRDIASPLPSASTPPAQLEPGFGLTAGQALRSANGKYTLTQQPDGNLVLADEAKRVQWSSQTSANPGATASLDRTGDFVVYAKSGTVLWRSSVNGQGALLQVRDDGTATITRADRQEVWSSKNERTRLYPGQALNTGQQRRSSDGRFILAQNADGNLVVTDAGKKVVWNAQTGGHQGAYTLMQSDGNLVVYGADKQPLWSSGTFGSSGAAAVLNTDGNLALTVGGKVVWGTATDGTTKLTAGQRLLAGQSRAAPNGQFTLLMQPDGNLVLQNAAKAVLWRSNTGGHPGASLRMQADGNLAVYEGGTGSTTALWSTKTTGRAATYLQVLDNGTVTLNTAAGQAVWKAP
ncbi:hypothetical protein [Dactylosporangium matsuzakiense]|uniref:Bulb-type lectin domain-containing protein n=2 Tax=Dactylosporangium matsuzakiense TaxID=53360 RepID=A0A9W6NKH6_9ACTN|nr:hypothetical protein [Dactylosporangium matsuzakiense]UWZ41148.1 hypothetical protein Dmats_25935 [Dactylosporangium matsuzakiense]GLL00940.1 hypothetical protein GCM10017581_026810 [Dactylosporangium matsuzakiense]